MHTVLHSLIHALKDCALTLPFLFAAYLIMEFFEHRTEIKLSKILSNEKLGPVGGAIAGCIPQCGMGILSSHLFSSGIISAGALIAVFISTSDEALPVILSHPDKILAVFPLLLVKIAAAVIAGYLFDLLYIDQSTRKMSTATTATANAIRVKRYIIYKIITAVQNAAIIYSSAR